LQKSPEYYTALAYILDTSGASAYAAIRLPTWTFRLGRTDVWHHGKLRISLCPPQGHCWQFVNVSCWRHSPDVDRTWDPLFRRLIALLTTSN